MKYIGFCHVPPTSGIGSQMERKLLLWAIFHLGHSIGHEKQRPPLPDQLKAKIPATELQSMVFVTEQSN